MQVFVFHLCVPAFYYLTTVRQLPLFTPAMLGDVLIYPGDAGGSIPGFSTLKAGQYLTHMKPPLFDVEVTMTVRSTFHLTHTPSHTFNLQPI